jgi:hypothetical protein
MATTAQAIGTHLLARIEAALATANGRRRERTLSLGHVLKMLRSVAGDPGVPCVYDDGGRVANAYKQRAVTTFCLVARVAGRIGIGITVADAKSTTPGRAFRCLQPWRQSDRVGGGPAGDAAAKWAVWATLPDVMMLDDPEVDAIIAATADTD